MSGGDFGVLVADTGTAATGYTDSTVAASTTYTYRIKAINEHGVSKRSRWFHIETPVAPVPGRPRGLTATATHDSVMLTWDDPGDDSIDGYVILRRNRETTASGEFSELVADTGTAATRLQRRQRKGQHSVHLPDQGDKRVRCERALALAAHRHAAAADSRQPSRRRERAVERYAEYGCEYAQGSAGSGLQRLERDGGAEAAARSRPEVAE